MLLRAATKADAPVLAAIHLHARRLAMPWLAQVHSDAATIAWFVAVVAAAPVQWWVAESGGAVTGYMALDGDMLDHLYVAPDRQERGTGSALLDKAKALSPTGLRLWTFQRNVRARSFYTARGFTEAAQTDGDNEEREPDVLYIWP